jgi:hypothetical protein
MCSKELSKKSLAILPLVALVLDEPRLSKLRKKRFFDPRKSFGKIIALAVSLSAK